MINAAKNIATLFFVALAVMLLIFGMNVLGSVHTALNQTYSNNTYFEGYTNSTLYSSLMTSYADTRNVFLDATNFLLYIFVGMTIFSSFTQKNNLTSYLFSFIISIIACVVVYYLFANIYNSFITTATAYLTDLPTFFFENFELLLVANVIAGIISFVFVQRGEA